uniref:START domain-containing protein n=1 Tax=Chromera velia CCMP2878 TaxID=1169474 RepID=A0A0G4H555_9ALVE|mmetsp:Transcript_746/g.1655  ORF Transcript_746/g.1655 Transcript_746/m.1655 type:complete len:331 (+) Transcript_746:187-1179(+)|eukprot:Cvel_841.t1-p1 / transcript=Cvel_841.t1 / gene=Cvel_841 / organism=Chromera_velia_CCMP2878 / gene_product=hypothetical protein / transcript_product=hypothetical protein / location=Cvel_scaffold26:69654-74512(+) / protein_length=330 / sequence_SO=supercontig / SO=protein_coding / is_pseudo=false
MDPSSSTSPAEEQTAQNPWDLVLQTAAETVDGVPAGSKEAKLREICLQTVKDNKALEKLFYFVGLREGWESNGNNYDVECEKVWDDETNQWVARGVVKYDKDEYGMTPLDWLQIYRDCPRYEGLDAKATSAKALAEFNKADFFLRAVYLSFSGFTVYSGRDFVCAQQVFILKGNKVAILTTSVPDDKWPQSVSRYGWGLVRGFMHFGGALMETLEDGSMQVTYVAHLDLKTGLPMDMMTIAPHLTDFAQPLTAFKEDFKTKGVTPSPLEAQVAPSLLQEIKERKPSEPQPVLREGKREVEAAGDGNGVAAAEGDDQVPPAASPEETKETA